MLRYRHLVVVALAATAVLVAWQPFAGARRSDRTTTFTVNAFVDSAHAVDNPPPGDSQGDMLVFTQKVYTDETKQKQIGTDQAYCVVTIANRSWLCNRIFKLKMGHEHRKGKITVTGLESITGPNSGQSHSLAITGGTGKWRSATGQVELVPKGVPEDQLTFHVTR